MRSLAVTMALVLVLVVVVGESGWAAEKPPLAITAIDPSHAAFGTKVKVIGHGLSGTRKVWFAVGYVKSKEAKFHVISDTELQVEAPEYLTTGVRASIVVETATGVTVTTPPELLTISNPATVHGDKFTLVQTGGAMKDGGDWVTFIEKEASVLKAGRLTLVANGGRLDDVRLHFEKTANLVFAERGAAIGDLAKKNAMILSVPHVSYSPVEELFTYEPGSDVRDAPQEPSPSQGAIPHISGVKPNFGVGGDIVEIHGKGFSDARSVAFVQSGRRLETAFRRKSDSLLRVEVPDLSIFWETVIVVENSQGVAFTLSRAPRSEDGTVEWIDKTGKHGGTGVGIGGVTGVSLIATGGVLAHGSGDICFVKDGGTLLAAAGGIDPIVYCEPNGKLPSPLRGAGKIVQVREINACLVEAYFNTRNRLPAGARP